MVEIIVKKPYERFDWRAEIEKRDEHEARKWQIAEYHRCAEDKIYWFNQYVWIIDVKQNKVLPFILWDHQLRLIKQLDKHKDTFIDKSREMGVSWTVMGWELHQVEFRHAFSALNISRKESEVQDSGNTFHSLHGRLHFMWDRQPPFIKPVKNNPFLTFQVPSMNSVIKGESANPNAGRDTQFTFVFIDEAAHIKCLDEMWKGVRNSTDCICLNSTPPKEIVNNKFVEIRDKQESGFDHASFHWSERPDRDQEWFEKKTAAMEEEEIAQELEINYDKAQTNRSYPEYKDSLHLATHRIYYNKNFKLNCFMDFGLGGEVMLFNQIDNEGRIYFIRYDIYRDKLTHELYREMEDVLHKLGYRGKIKDITFIGDTAGNKRSRATKMSVIDEYYQVSKGDMIIRSQTMSNYDKMLAMKHCLKRTIKGKQQFNISHANDCRNMAKAMKFCSLDKTRGDHKDNKYTHVVNAAEYGVNWFFPLKRAEVVIVGSDPHADGMETVGFDENTIIPDKIIDAEDIEKEQKIIGSTTIGTILENRRSNRRSLIW